MYIKNSYKSIGNRYRAHQVNGQRTGESITEEEISVFSMKRLDLTIEQGNLKKSNNDLPLPAYQTGNTTKSD